MFASVSSLMSRFFQHLPFHPHRILEEKQVFSLLVYNSTSETREFVGPEIPLKRIEKEDVIKLLLQHVWVEALTEMIWNYLLPSVKPGNLVAVTESRKEIRDARNQNVHDTCFFQMQSFAVHPTYDYDWVIVGKIAKLLYTGEEIEFEPYDVNWGERVIRPDGIRSSYLIGWPILSTTYFECYNPNKIYSTYARKR